MILSFKEFVSDAEREEAAQIIRDNELFFSAEEMGGPDYMSGSKCLVTNDWGFLPHVDEPVSNNFKYAIIIYDNGIAIAQCLVCDSTPYMMFDKYFTAYVNRKYRKQGICERMINMTLYKYPEAIDYKFRGTTLKELLHSK